MPINDLEISFEMQNEPTSCTFYKLLTAYKYPNPTSGHKPWHH